MRVLAVTIALVAALAACSTFRAPSCDLVVATNPRGVLVVPGQALGSPDQVLATREDIDVAASSVGSEGVAPQQIDVVTLKLDADAADRFDAFAADPDGGNLVIAVGGRVVFTALPGHDETDAGVMTTHGVPSNLVDLPTVLAGCGVPPT